MKKNGIAAFEGMSIEMSNVVGGRYTYDTETSSGNEDCQTVTEPGDSYNGQYNNGTSNWQDEFEVYTVSGPGSGGGGTLPGRR